MQENTKQEEIGTAVKQEEKIKYKTFATFFLEKQEFAVDINKVRETITSEKKVIQIPNSIDIVEGILNIRNEIIPVINLRTRFESDNKVYPDDTIIAIIVCKNRFIGIRFDDISEIIEIQNDKVNKVESNSDNKNIIIEGVINYSEDKIIQVINPDTLFDKYDIPFVTNNDANKVNIFKSRKVEKIETEQRVIFILAKQEYAVDINEIKEIISVPEIKQRVNIGEYLKGMIVLRGQNISVVDTHKYLKLPNKEIDKESRILIIKTENPYGLLFDAVNEIITIGRQEIEINVHEKLQKLLTQYETGIKIDQVILQDVNPPDEVKASFNEVNEAEQEKEKLINQALSEYNKIIPKARGQAQQQIEEAKGYALERVNNARGEANRFASLYREYAKARLSGPWRGCRSR